MTIPVSVVVLTRNEAANIASCLTCLHDFESVFVVDSHSTDGTPEKAAQHRVRVVPFHWNGQYPKKKQWCLEHLPHTHDWVLFVDADERVSPKLSGEIAALMEHGPRASGYFIPSPPVFGGKRLRFGRHNRKMALVNRRKAHFPPINDLDTAMGEVEGHYQPVLDGKAGRLKGTLVHHDEKPVAAWFDRHNRYAQWEAHLAATNRLHSLAFTERGLRRVMKNLFHRLPRGPVAFVDSYILKFGFLDGRAGLDYALARAFYYWQIGVRQRELSRAGTAAPHTPLEKPAA